MFNLFKRTKRVKATIINKDFFVAEIIENKKPAMVTFSTAWCGACKMQKPLINDTAHHHREDDVIIGFVDTDNQTDLAREFSITSIPTTIAFKNGSPVFKKTGLLARRDLETLVEQLKTSE